MIAYFLRTATASVIACGTAMRATCRANLLGEGHMTYTIVSTYPVEGTKNIGDRLIEYCTKRLVEDVKGATEYFTVFRADDLDSKVREMNDTAAVIFACLAIRRDMVPKVYNMKTAVDQVRVPFVPLASGTSLRTAELAVDGLGARTEFDSGTAEFVRAIARRAEVFSCRGEATYNAVRSFGVGNAAMTGDVAFYERRFDGLRFKARRGIDRIAISTPHQPQIYADQFYALVERCAETFPQAERVIVVHGLSEWLDAGRVEASGATIRDIFAEDLEALDVYSDFDVHIGYRVHGHVSALKRRVPSYILATDGRGYDYGMTLRLGTIWNAWRVVPSIRIVPADEGETGTPKREARLLTRADMDVVDYMLDVVKRDENDGFDRFLGFEHEIEKIGRRLVEFVELMP